MGYNPYNENERSAVILQTFEIEFYKKADGSCTIKEFLDLLNEKMRAKLLRTVLLLEQNGNELREPYSKHLGDGIFELRVIQGSDITRALYFFVVGHKIILTNGFVKKTQRTPQREIELAKKYRADYLAGKEQ
jgi:phage-related protein